MNLKLRLIPVAALAATLLPAIAAHAELKPTLVVMHRNIGRAQDEANWSNLANQLASHGFRVVSLALHENESAEQGAAQLRADFAGPDQQADFIVVGTAAVAETANVFAQSRPRQLRAIVYLSADGAVPAYGPRTVDIPTTLSAKVPTYQVKVSDTRKSLQSRDGASTVYHVREEGKSTLPRIADLEATLENIARMNPANSNV